MSLFHFVQDFSTLLLDFVLKSNMAQFTIFITFSITCPPKGSTYWDQHPTTTKGRGGGI
jgi:hypothetical protein